MIKKGYDLIKPIPTKVFKVAFLHAFKGENVKCCEVCKNRLNPFCRLMCKFKNATYTEFLEERRRKHE